MVGCNLASLVERILMPHRITRMPESSEATRILLELIYVMTLAHLHFRFLRVFVPLGLDVICVLGTLEIDYFQDSLP